MPTKSSSGRSAKGRLKIAPTALMVHQRPRFGVDAPWFMGVVLQQACEAMVGGARR